MKHIFLLILFLISFNASALSIENRIEDPILQLKAKEIFKQIKCVTCDGESINDSKAKVALSMRNIVRNELLKGSSEQQIIAIFTKTYGDSILIDPPFKAGTFLLWTLPFIMIIFAIIVLFVFLNRKRSL